MVIALLFAGCATEPNTTALRVGMTKEEAIKAMGTPNSISAPGGGVEYLNYTITEYGASSYSSWTRPYYVRIADGKVQAFGYSEQIGRFGPAGSANLVARSAGLKIGMTKEEAIQIMGQPASVSANGNYEYLNYTSSETSPSGFSMMTRPYYVRLLDGKVEAFGFTEQIGRPIGTSGAIIEGRRSSETVTVTSVTPMKLGVGKRQDLAVTVRYSTPGRKKSVLLLMVNAEEPRRYVSAGERVLDGESGEVTVTISATPAYSSAEGPFRVGARLVDYPYTHGEATRSLAVSFSAPVDVAN